MSIAKWTCGAMLVVIAAATAACGAPADGSESTEENQAAETKGGGTGSKEGQACHVVSGGNAGKSGTYTQDVDGLNCAGSWGSSNCDTGKCKDGAAITTPPYTPPWAPIHGVGTIQGADAQQEIGRTPFCLPGEKVVCTLGPPPVCHCAPPAPLPIERAF